jgi:lipopolysaccharide transport system ATP-binding protein
MKPAIEIRNLGKKYKLSTAQRYVALRDVISDSFKNIFNTNNSKEDFWALQDINLDIMPGERLGIIGRNGAGKSTLLKMISRIVPPTKGEAIIRGRVGSLLEVGTGFHPELTGRENIYLNGSILGLKKAEINSQLDAIIDFSGVEKFIDTPLKHYSSGMEMRLAFSVAAHLRAEILLIDEVLAVGDMEFQKKCLGKMEEISKSQGRTILFVSHNLKAVNDICNKILYLNKGKMVACGSTEEVTRQYINSLNTGVASRPAQVTANKPIAIAEISSLDQDGVHKHSFKHKEKIAIGISLQNNSWPHEFTIGFGLNRSLKGRIVRSQCTTGPMSTGSTANYTVWLPAEYLTPGSFTVDVSILDHKKETIDLVTDALSFDIAVANTEYEGIEFDYGVISNPLQWEGP